MVPVFHSRNLLLRSPRLLSVIKLVSYFFLQSLEKTILFPFPFSSVEISSRLIAGFFSLSPFMYFFLCLLFSRVFSPSCVRGPEERARSSTLVRITFFHGLTPFPLVGRPHYSDFRARRALSSPNVIPHSLAFAVPSFVPVFVRGLQSP